MTSEEKIRICRYLTKAIRECGLQGNILDLEYEQINETFEIVLATWYEGGVKSFNVTGKNGLEMIRTIIDGLLEMGQYPVVKEKQK